MKRSLKKGLPGGPNEKVFSKEGYRSTSPDVNNLFNFIPSGNITMKEKDGTPLKKGPLLGIDNLGNSQLMLPGANYQFPGDVVKEIPLAKKGGPFQNSNIYATNKLFVKNPLFKKRKKAKKAKGIYNPKAKYTYQPGGEIEYNQLPEKYKYALQNFIYPNVSTEPNDYEENENGELVPVIRPGYNPTNNTITYDPNNPVENINNDWWREHELFHQLQTLAGGENTSDAGMLLQKPNSYVASNDSMGTYYNRRDSDVEKTIDNMIAQNPNLKFIPREKLAQSTYEEGMERPGFIGAEDLQYADPSTLEGEARQYEQYIEEGNPSIFSKKQFGGPKGQCPLGYIWNGIECIPNPFEIRPSQRTAVYMDKDGTYKMDPVYQQYSQQKFNVAESNKKAQDFNKMYAQSKNYKRLLKKQGYTPEEIEDRINSIMNINDIRYTDEGPSWVGTNEDTGNEFISYNVTDPGDWPGFDQIAAHEWGHVGVDSGANPLKPKEREEFINRINKEQAGVTGNPDDLVHDMEPQENRADLLQLRQQLQEAGVFDSTKRKRFTKKDLSKYKKLMESSKRNWDNMWNRMFRLYDDDSIIYFMNNVAKNNSNEDLQVAKYGFELDLTEDEIQKYVKGGYVVEDISVPSLTRMDDGGENACPPDYYWNGQACVTRTHTEIDPRYIAEHPDEATRIQNEGEVVVSREASDIGKLRGEYREKNPIGIFLDEKKRQYLRRNKGLNKAAGVTMENFPEDVLQNFKNEYDYLTNNYAVKKLGKKEGWNPKRRGDWVNELTPGERDAVAESKYGSKLQPSYWSRSLAGLQELGNEVIQNLPVIAAGPLAPGMAIASTLAPESDVLKFDIPGLTKKEQKEIAESKLGFLETLAPLDTPGAAIANYVENRGLSTGSDYKELPSIFSGEKMANVSDTEAMLLNPLTYAGMESIPELVLNAPKLLKNSGKLIGKLESPELISNTSNILKNEVKLLPEETINLRSKVLKSVPEDAPYIRGDELLPDYKTFNTKGKAITYNEGIDLLEDMANKYPVLQESPRMPVYYHGTTSASLPGIIKNEGLVPTGELLREGKVPLTGELGAGATGINSGNISTAMARGHTGALDYAIGLSGRNKVNVEDDLAKWFERGGREEFFSSPYSPDISFYDDLKNKRLTEWQSLSDAEKALVQDNYPVMFGINPTKGNADRFVIPKSDISDEVGISGKINFEEIPSIFVPKSKVSALQQQLGTRTKVLPIEDFMQNYKNADKYNQMGYAKGGIISNLTKKEIDKLIKQGYIIEEID